MVVDEGLVGQLDRRLGRAGRADGGAVERPEMGLHDGDAHLVGVAAGEIAGVVEPGAEIAADPQGVVAGLADAHPALQALAGVRHLVQDAPDDLSIDALARALARAVPFRRRIGIAPMAELDETVVETVLQLGDIVEAVVAAQVDGGEHGLMVRIARDAVEQAQPQRRIVGDAVFAGGAQARDWKDRRPGLRIVGADAGG